MYQASFNADGTFITLSEADFSLFDPLTMTEVTLEIIQDSYLAVMNSFTITVDYLETDPCQIEVAETETVVFKYDMETRLSDQVPL